MRIPAPPLWLLSLLFLLRALALLGEPLPVSAQIQSQPYSNGQSSVAMAIHYLTGKEVRDYDINQVYGFELLRALNEECGPAGYKWRDAGDLEVQSWALIERKLVGERTPVLLALNGPEFCPKSWGKIVLLTGISGPWVSYIDPADGKRHITTRERIEGSPLHPDGKFVFVAESVGQSLQQLLGLMPLALGKS